MIEDKRLSFNEGPWDNLGVNKLGIQTVANKSNKQEPCKHSSKNHTSTNGGHGKSVAGTNGSQFQVSSSVYATAILSAEPERNPPHHSCGKRDGTKRGVPGP